MEKISQNYICFLSAGRSNAFEVERIVLKYKLLDLKNYCLTDEEIQVFREEIEEVEALILGKQLTHLPQQIFSNKACINTAWKFIHSVTFLFMQAVISVGKLMNKRKSNTTACSWNSISWRSARVCWALWAQGREV